jgi:predicted enzyme related to lactoylglutathione lyase
METRTNSKIQAEPSSARALLNAEQHSEKNSEKNSEKHSKRKLGRGLLLAAFGVSVAQPLTAQTQQLSALVVPASEEMHFGKISFVELITPNLSVAKRFYAGMFDWEFRDLKVGADDYSEASLGGRLVAGLTQRTLAAGEQGQSAWLTFISVRDVKATMKTALSRGATVLLEPRSQAGRGQQAVFADPQGAVFAVLASSSGDPPDELADPGEWIWSSLSTTEPEADAGFYQDVFDYEVHDLDDDVATEGVADAAPQHLLFATEDYARASANILPTQRANARPHWLNYVHVEDVEEMCAKLISLGGRVLVEPRMDRQGGRVAVVADPMGAPFGLLEWPESEDKEVTS